MDSRELQNRTQQFALNVMSFTNNIPGNRASDIILRQLLRSAFSVGANYRAACRAQSYVHFKSKISIVEEEADECVYWMELLLKGKLTKEENIKKIMQEAKELTAIFTSTRKTLTQNYNKNFKNKSK